MASIGSLISLPNMRILGENPVVSMVDVRKAKRTLGRC